MCCEHAVKKFKRQLNGKRNNDSVHSALLLGNATDAVSCKRFCCLCAPRNYRAGLPTLLFRQRLGHCQGEPCMRIPAPSCHRQALECPCEPRRAARVVAGCRPTTAGASATTAATAPSLGLAPPGPTVRTARCPSNSCAWGILQRGGGGGQQTHAPLHLRRTGVAQATLAYRGLRATLGAPMPPLSDILYRVHSSATQRHAIGISGTFSGGACLQHGQTQCHTGEPLTTEKDFSNGRHPL